MKSTISLIIMLAVLAMGATVSAHHEQTIGGVDIVHSLAPEKNLTYDGNMTALEAYALLSNPATGDDAVILDVRSPWERNGSSGGCLTRVALGMKIDPYNAGIPIWEQGELCGDVPVTSPKIPVHVQGPIGIAYNAQASDGTDLIGWPFRAAGFMIYNPDLDDYIAALEVEGVMYKDQAIIVMCAMGFRSKYIADYLTTELGYNKVYSMEDGLSGWNKKGLPVSTSEADWIVWDSDKLYDPSRLASPKWTNSVFMAGGDPVIPEWLGAYVPQNMMVGYNDPSCTAPGNLVGLNGPWPVDKQIADLGISPSLTSIKLPANWSNFSPTLWRMCVGTLMGPPHNVPGGDAQAQCTAWGVPDVVPGFFDEWPIEKGKYIEGGIPPIRAEVDPCPDMFSGYFPGHPNFPLQDACEIKLVENQLRDCVAGDPQCVGERTYCWAMPPFGSGFAPVTVPDGKFWTPDLPWKVQMNFATP